MHRAIISHKSYAAANRCHDCPQSNGPDGCPKWVELIETNPAGDERMTCGCLDVHYTTLAVELIKAANRPAHEISAMREDVAQRMNIAASMVLNQVRATATNPTFLGRVKQLFLSHA